MGNTLITGIDNKNIRNDTLLGKEVSKILREKTDIYDKIPNSNKLIKQPVNQIKACCMDIVKKEPGDNDFITVKLPEALDESDKRCKDNKKCMGEYKLGLQFKGDRYEMCGNDLIPGQEGICDGWIVNRCAKDLYDRGCIIIGKNEKGKNVRMWNKNNKNCFDEDGNLIYGNEECACVNSSTGFNLNNDPSNKMKGGMSFQNAEQNPYGLEGSESNNYTKYSMNLFDYKPVEQYPQLFDKRCSSRINSASNKKGQGKAYIIPEYKNSNLNLCLEDINTQSTKLEKSHFTNLEQNKNCQTNGSLILETEPKDREVEINKLIKVGRRESNRIENEARIRLRVEEKAKFKNRKISGELKDNIENNQQDINDLKYNYFNKNKRLLIDKIKDKSYLKKKIEDKNKLIKNKNSELHSSNLEYIKSLRDNLILNINKLASDKKLEETKLKIDELNEILAQKESDLTEAQSKKLVSAIAASKKTKSKLTISEPTCIDETSTSSVLQVSNNQEESITPYLFGLTIFVLALVIFYMSRRRS